MKQLLKKAKAIVAILILTLCFSGCENSDDNLPIITAGFTHTINPYTGTVTFINTSSDVKYYLWSFGDGTTSTEINPIKTYVDGTYKVVLEIRNVAGASDTYEDTIIIGIIAAPDTVAPVITLVGSPKIDVVVGGTFTDPGTTASDNVDGDITSRVVVAGDAVNVNKAGTYVITYNVSDSSANAATQVTRTVTVAEDTVRPVITLTGSSTINVTLGGTFTDPGATATDNVDGNISNRIVVAGDTVDTNKEGTYVITYNVKDAAANAATQVTRTVIVRAGTGSGGGTAAGDIAVNGGFEDGNLNGWAVYNNGGTIAAVTTQPSTGTYCAKLFASAETGLNPTLKQERKAAGTIAVGDKVKITFDYKGALTGESGTYSIQSFVEATDGVNQVVNISVSPTSNWQTYTTTYTVASGDISGGITLEFVAICGGVSGCSSTLYLDNVSVIINP
jgi:hypothetical protein